MNTINKYIKDTRLKLNYTQAYVAEFCNLSIRGYQKLEKSYNTPRVETLEKLSNCFQENLFSKISEFDLRSFQKIFELEKQIIECYNVIRLEKLLLEASNILVGKDEITKVKLYKLMHYCRGKILFINKNYKESIEELYISIKLITPHGEKNIKFILSELETKLIIIYALAFKYLDNNIKRELILREYQDYVTVDNEYYDQYMYNLGYAKYNNYSYNEALLYFNRALEIAKKRISLSIHTHFFAVAICRFKLGDKSWRQTLLFAIEFSKNLDNNKHSEKYLQYLCYFDKKININQNK